jgi:hypothetical protein
MSISHPVSWEPHILASPSDREAELVVRNDDLDAALLLIHHDLGDLGRGEGIDDKCRRIGRPGNDVDLFALQFGDHRLNPAAAHADAGADRIDPAVVRNHRDLGPAPRIARYRADFDDPVIDFGNLLSEELGHELRMRTRQEDLRPARFLPDIIDIGSDPFALTEAFPRQKFVAAQDRLGTSEIDDDIAEFHPLRQTVDDFADPILELTVLPLPFGIPHLLDDDLLGRLCGDPPEIDRRQRIGNEVADFGSGVETLGDGKTDLGRLVLDGFRDLTEAQQADFSGLAIDLRPNIIFLTVFRAAGLLDRLLHRLEHLVAIDALVAGDAVRDLKEFGPGIGCEVFHLSLARGVSFGRPCVPQSSTILLLLRCTNQLISEDEFRAHDRRQRQFHLALGKSKANGVARDAQQTAAKPLSAFDEGIGLKLCFESAEAVIIFGPNQGPVDSRGAYLELVADRDRIGDIEKGGNRMADIGAIFDRHARFVQPLGHDLQCRPPSSGKSDTDQAIAHSLKRGRNQRRDTIRLHQNRHPAAAAATNKKEWATAHPSSRHPASGRML